jgi:hypothetical protein
MKHAVIELSSERFGRSEAGLVYGGLHLKVDEQRFPDSRWTDFVVVLLAWWCRALARVIEGAREPVEVRFMEGPYVVMIGPMHGHSVRLKLVDAGLKRRVRYEADVLIDPLVESLLAAAGKLVVECRTRDWWSKDADELVDAMAVLKRASIRIVN